MNVALHICSRAIVVIVHQVRYARTYRSSCNQLEVWILRSDGIEKLCKPAVVAARSIKPVFVTYLDIGQVERFSMAICRANRAPFCRCVTCNILDLIQSFVNVGLQTWSRIFVLSAQRVAGEHSKDRLHFQVFAPLQVLQQAKSVRRSIVPRAAVSGTLRDIPDSILPGKSLVKCVALQ